jgi:hypothetical protein
MSINSSTGQLNWTPAAGQNGTFNFEVRATNTAGNPDAPNRTMAFSVTVGGTSTGAPTGVDLDAASDTGTSSTDNITNVVQPQITVSGVTSGALVRLYDGTTLIGQATASGSTVTITPSAALAGGSRTISASQQPSGGSESAKSTALSITIDTTPPSAFSNTLPTTAGANFGYVFDLANPDEGQSGVTYSLVGAPAGMAITANTGLVTWTPTLAQVGANNFTVRITDAAGNARTQAATITVASQSRQAMPDFDLTDVNPNSPTFNQSISPRDQLTHVSVWYLIHST